MQERFELIEDLFTDENGEMTAMEFVLTVLCAFLFGLVLGMFLSPKKHSVIGSNNGNNSPGCLTFDTTDEDEDEE